MKNDLEELNIYNNYLDLYYYTYMITEKFPKIEKHSLCCDLKNTMYKGFCFLIDAQKSYSKVTRLKYLNQLDATLKVLKLLVRISYKRKYISAKNYGAWARKITNVSNMNAGWINSCLRQ